jgi:cell division protein FtsX
MLSTKGEADVVFKGLIAAAAAVALSATPAIAAANSPAVVPATETVEGDNAMFGEGGFIIPLLAVVAVILGILAATSDDDDDLPVSP